MDYTKANSLKQQEVSCTKHQVLSLRLLGLQIKGK